MPQERTAIDDFKDAVLVAAAQAIVSEMTPEKMQACAEAIIASALHDLTGSHGPLTQAVKATSEKVMLDNLSSPPIQHAIQMAVRAGIDAAVEKMPGEIKGKITDLAFKSIENAIASAKQGSRY